MVQILDQHHDNILCSQCHKYLSVLPVKVYEDGIIKCGRCSSNDDGGTVSLYENIAAHCLFKCVNRYEGCRKLLTTSEVILHEEVCIGKKYPCPNCDIKSMFSGLELIQHFKHNHNSCLLTNNYVYLSLSTNCVYKKNYIYIKEDIIFVINLQYVPTDVLYISAVTLSEFENIKQYFIITQDTLSFKHETAKQKCLSVLKFTYDDYYQIDVRNIVNHPIKLEILLDTMDIPIRSYEVDILTKQCYASKPTLEAKECQTIPLEQIHTVKLTSEFCKKFPGYSLTACGTALHPNSVGKRIDLTCSNCKQMMSKDVYSCVLKEHLVCWDCKSWCGLCDCAINGRNSEVSSLTEYLLFPCKWKCGNQLVAGDLRQHELFCNKNTRTCPICKSNFNVNVLKTHLPLAHNCEFVEEFDLTAFLLNQRRSGKNFFFMINNNMFRIKWRIYNKQYDICITPCDNMEGLELFVILANAKYCKIGNDEITVFLETTPKLYLKYYL